MLPHRILLLVAGLCPLLAAGQERGDLLIATEQITEESFADTIILLLHYADDGAVGVAINRPTWVTTRELFPELDYTHGYRGPVFHGGPLAQATVLVLSGSAQLADGDREAVVEGVYMSSDLSLLEALLEETNDDAQLRFYAGHASWGPGQLDEEIAAGAWRTLGASASLIFDADPGSLWARLAAPGAGMTVYESPAAAPQPAQAETDRATHEAYANAE